MLDLIIIILGISFLLYTLLGGADFGAGIIETCIGNAGEKTVSKAMAPVWEANHIWLILAIVIMFMGFPMVYYAVSVYLHIPLLIVLIGIILRGSAFIFRFYDVGDNPAHKYFTLFFKLSSFITPIFLGVIIGAMTMGRIHSDTHQNFYIQFIRPWFNIFCFVMGIFSASIFAYIAAVFLMGETSDATERKRYTRLARRFLLLTFILGLCVFLTAELEKLSLFRELLKSFLATIAFAAAVLLIPMILYLFNHPKIIYLRIVICVQVSLLLIGWFGIHYPILVYQADGNHLSILNAHAPPATLFQLLIALLIGLVLVLPSFYFLFKVFKKPGEHEG